jgi:hypothetical protein
LQRRGTGSYKARSRPWQLLYECILKWLTNFADLLDMTPQKLPLESVIHVREISGSVDGSHRKIIESPRFTGPKFDVAATGGVGAPGGG